jgi:diadenosine tetraphosphate (Ap4A) HIT family hydrolase
MSFHKNFQKWQALADPRNCPVCQNHPMPPGMVDIVELPHSWLSTEIVDCLKGACHQVAKYHVLELYELSDQELLGFMKDVQVSARALKAVTSAAKINYEIHGNSLPHLHVHLYPRYMDDPFPGQPIDDHQKKRWYSDEEFMGFVNEMREKIDFFSIDLLSS